MIISPTRELAVQIFEVLRKIGRYGHLFAAGLVIGGKSLHDEQHALSRMNIVVCTPGRILQHLSQTASFAVDTLRMLVLDEADRIMDMGFQKDVDAIVQYLPLGRQTLLFSATQTKRVSDLARLSLRDPTFVSVHETASSATPITLQQNFVVTPLSSKLDTLWSFLQASKKCKLLVFLSSGKQVRYIYETFRKLRPGLPLMHLHGRQRQTARFDLITRFSTSKHACLFATDVAARGLDFPAVDWVVQLDCPEDVDTYIHRVGRTARYERDGKAVLFLDPSEEEAMLARLGRNKVPVERINVRAKKQQSIRNQLQNLCFKDPELKYLGQKAFVSYVRSIHVAHDKDVFNIKKYAMDEFAASLGLPGAPRIKFTQGDAEAAKRMKNAPRKVAEVPNDSSEDEDQDENLQAKPISHGPRTKYDRMFERQNQDVLAPHYSAMIDDEGLLNGRTSNEFGPNPLNGFKNTVTSPQPNNEADSEDGIFTVKRRIHPPADSQEGVNRNLAKKYAGTTSISHAPTKSELIADSNRRRRALASRKKTAKLLGKTGERLIFDDKTGEARPPQTFMSQDEVKNEKAVRDEERRIFLGKEQEEMRARDFLDQQEAKRKRKEKRDKRKGRERELEGVDEEKGAPSKDESPLSDSEIQEDNMSSARRLEVLSEPFKELQGLYEDDAEDRESEEAEWQSANRKRMSKRQRVGASEKSTQELEAMAENLLS